jgi:stage IV sporulation protein A
MVIPKIENMYMRERARDELPQSGSGRTVMTAEPKFVPEEAVTITAGGASFDVRLIDCVGYMVDGAVGADENGEPRMVSTPWFDHDVSMIEAAETGTKKVISEHSTIGIVMTTDGSITDIPRSAYLAAEDRVIGELLTLGKPFIIVINSANPEAPAAKALKKELTEKYNVSCMTVNCLSLEESDVTDILKTVLLEFPISMLGIYLPPWLEALPPEHAIKSDLFASLCGKPAQICLSCETPKPRLL